MANGVERELVVLFSEEELREMSGVKRGEEYIEVTCGCTSHRYGDAVGRLRVFINGELEITCECTPGCDEDLVFDARVLFFLLDREGQFSPFKIVRFTGKGMHSVRKNSSCGPFTERRKLSYCLSSILASETTFRWTFRAKIMQLLPCAQLAILCPAEEDTMTPAAFEKHSGRETARKWKNNVWVIVNGEKVPLSKTVLLKYYNQASKNGNGSHRSNNGRVCHRDEFVRCSKCNKERRFRLRTKEECQIHHDALADANWKCADMPFDNESVLSEMRGNTTENNEEAEGYTEVAPVLQHARAALPVCALGVRSVASRIAAAKPALTSPGMQKFEFKTMML
ncbi:hypothetical protein NC653_041782 [Populus alba x Populus x berolinensis]|uniref:Protein ULTRAPETALA 1 n=1 Tax=Populus alba x Populus x berolinensis TaxID=444605 RepID=A0AAD6PPQ1_9ROSI|nr:hypothetical protein NC653_041782 [Populus alba x Populus x berolinensis]